MSKYMTKSLKIKILERCLMDFEPRPKTVPSITAPRPYDFICNALYWYTLHIAGVDCSRKRLMRYFPEVFNRCPKDRHIEEAWFVMDDKESRAALLKEAIADIKNQMNKKNKKD